MSVLLLLLFVVVDSVVVVVIVVNIGNCWKEVVSAVFSSNDCCKCK